MTYPEGYIWEYPGVYSLTVQYGMHNNFYFCPFVGVAVINFCEFYRNKYYVLGGA